jgi:CheY-like chemotaxis protein
VAQILVVDDDSALRGLLRRMLELEGYEVVEANNGYEGLQQYLAAPTDLVITDIQMPVMDGMQMIRELRHTFPYAKVMAISAGQSTLEMVRPGVQRAMGKPFHLMQFVTAVQELLCAPACLESEYEAIVASSNVAVPA